MGSGARLEYRSQQGVPRDYPASGDPADDSGAGKLLDRHVQGHADPLGHYSSRDDDPREDDWIRIVSLRGTHYDGWIILPGIHADIVYPREAARAHDEYRRSKAA